MMTSVGNDRSRGTRDKMQTQTCAQIQKPVQATAEQIRLAQMIYDKNDADFEEKVKQLMEVTGKNPDESIVALHDCNGDVNRAINVLLEGNSDTTSWETVGKKKSLGTGKDGLLENKENREKRGDKVTRGRAISSRRGRGNRGREYRVEENGVDVGPGDRHAERGRRGRGRGFSGRSRGRGAGRFSAQGMGTFNPTDYADSATNNGFGATSEIWESGQNNGTGGWQNSMEDWVTEDWNEDSPGFGEPAATKIVNSSGSQLHEQLKSSGLVEFAAQTRKPSSNTHSWEAKSTSQSTVLSQFDFKTQPEPSPVLSQMTQRQQQASEPVLNSYSSQIKLRELSPVESTTAKMMQLLPISTDSQITNSQQIQQKQLKTQKRKIPAASKIPASAVEMPGSTNVSELNVQFGALEFGSEASLSEFGTGNQETINQTQNHLFSNSVSDSMSQFLSISSAVQEPTNSSAVSSCSSTTAPITPVTSTFDQNSVHGIPYQNSLGTSPQKEASSQNGLGTQQALEATICPTVKSAESQSLQSVSSLSTGVSTASLLPPVSQHSASLTSLNQTIELPSSSLSQLSSSLPNHQSSSLTSATSLTASSSHAHTNVDNSLQTTETFSTALTFTTITTSSVGVSSSLNTTNSLGLSAANASLPTATTRAVPSVSSGKAPPNLPPGVPPILHNQYIVGPGGLLPAYPIYGYDDLQVLQSRLPMDYYGMAFPAPAAALAGRDGGLASNPYSGDLAKFGRGDSASPAPATTLAQPQQNQTHHTTQQAFLNPALPPGYSYTGLPYYAGMPGVPSTFQYGPAMFLPPASAKHGVNMNTASAAFQQAGGYGQHGYGTGYEDLNQGGGAGDYSKGAYSGSTQAQTKSAAAGPGKGISVNSTNIVPDMAGSVYKTQSFDKQGFHAGTPPPFNLPSALGGTGTLNPGAAAGYAPPFLHIVSTHQQPHSQMLHHHLQQDNQGGSGQRNQQSSIPQKSQVNKPNYGSSPYWGN
ncbi:ubiquitin-associated protein 2a isoform X3 [Scyliorhinus canicula]|uniref:ubiquitin-associated protein 2a isoform X3 n=1 Tax=Scyliorhinus canicula TaxID=7830 RepID=UPI0018F57A92|nr:ubiquitin-associated protein 2a isoform X3 [Scyliorhinus canicula]